MSATIISITTHRRYEKGSKRGRQRVFTMGYHTYSGGPGCCWSCNYWIKKTNKGTAWELYVSSESALSYKYRLYNGTYSAEHLRDYFESVDFELDEDHWREETIKNNGGWQRGNPRNIRPHLVNRYLICWFNDLLEAYRIKSEIDLVTKGIVTNRWY